VHSNLQPGTHAFTVTDVFGCSSEESSLVIISMPPSAPNAPLVGAITQPTIDQPFGSVVLNSLPISGAWILNPGNINGSGQSYQLTNLIKGTYNYSVTDVLGCISTPSENVVINGIPMSNAGNDQSVFELTTVSLNGSGSSDPDNDVLSYQWTAPAGILLNAYNIPNPQFIAPEVSLNTDYIFSLTVNDGTLSSTSDQVVVTVNNKNKAPVANAGTDQSVMESVQVLLNGSSSFDPDNDGLTYQWNAPSGIILSSSTALNPTFISPDVTSKTDYIISLVVSDGNLSSSADQVIITVNPENDAPVANAGPDQSVQEETMVYLNGSNSYDPNGDFIYYQWIVPPGISLSNPNGSATSFIAPSVTVDTDYILKLKVTDGKLYSIEDEVIIHVLKSSIPVANAGSDQSHYQYEQVYLDGSGSYDPDDKTLSYLWTAPAGIVLSSANVSNPTFVASQVTTNTKFTFKLIVNNGYYYSTPDFVDITIKNVNNLPIANAGDNKEVDEGILTSLDGTNSTDPDNDALKYMWTAPLGVILSSNTDPKPSFTAPSVEYDDIFKFYLTVFDGTEYSQSDEVEIKVKQVNRAPKASAGDDQKSDEGSLVLLKGGGSYDEDGNVITYQWLAPKEIKLSSPNAVNPQFIAPEVVVDTDFKISLIVNDGKANSIPDEVVIRVHQINKAPLANAGPNQSVTENSTVQLNGNASSDPDMDHLTYQWSGPEGIVLSSNTIANPTFTAPEVSFDNSYIFNLVVNDGKLNSIVDQVVIKVLQVNKVPFANAGTDQTVKENALVMLDGSGSFDADKDALTYYWTAPEGIILSSVSSSKPSFTMPGALSDMHYTFSLIVSDGISSSGPDEVTVFLQTDHPPYVKNPIDDILVDRKSPDQSIDLDYIFEDNDPGDILRYSIATNTNPEVVIAIVENSNLRLSFSTTNVGVAEIVINANSNGKEVQTSFMVEVKNPTWNRNSKAIDIVKIYPNPTKGDFKIKFGKMPDADTWITVFDPSGRIVEKLQPTNIEQAISLNGNPPGFYFVRIDDDMSKTYKLILID